MPGIYKRYYGKLTLERKKGGVKQKELSVNIIIILMKGFLHGGGQKNL